MDKQKRTKNYGTAYYAMAFLAAFFFEFYWIMVKPYDYFMLLGIGVIMIIMGYLTVDSIMKAKADSDEKKAEQNDMMLKAQKAIYIATKKNAKDAKIQQAQSIKAVELMMNKMITSQQALLEEKKSDDSDMTSLIDQLSESNAKLAKEVQSAITVNQLVKANADLVKNVKEALNASALNNASATADLSAYVSAAVTEPVVTPKQMVITEPVVTPEPVIIPEPVVTPEPEVISELGDSDFDLNEFDMSELPDSDDITGDVTNDIADDIPDDITDDIANDINEDLANDIADDIYVDTLTEMEDEINLASMEESEALEAITVPDEMTPELDAAIDDGSDDELIIDDSNPFASQVDDSPNRQLTEEEIAALFASL